LRVRVAVVFWSRLPSVRARSPMSETILIPRLRASGALEAVEGAETDREPLEGSIRLLGRDGPLVGDDAADERSVVYPLRIRAVEDRASCEGEVGMGRRDTLGDWGRCDALLGEGSARGK
jgi:hypothetical protein